MIEEKSMTNTIEETTEEKLSDYDKEMTFLDHLEELRWRLIKSVLGLIAGMVIVGININWIVNNVILHPIRSTNPPLTVINTIPYGQITFYLVVMIAGGLIIGSPWILFQIWKFVQPGLLPKERKYISRIVFFTTFCFLAGVSFAYFVMLPYMLQFFATFGSADIKNLISVTEYISFVVEILLISGIIFELPMVSYFLARLGILTPDFMKRYRRHAIVVILIVAALVTPTTDPFTMSIFALPMIILYEISIFIAYVGTRKREQASMM